MQDFPVGCRLVCQSPKPHESRQAENAPPDPILIRTKFSRPPSRPELVERPRPNRSVKWKRVKDLRGKSRCPRAGFPFSKPLHRPISKQSPTFQVGGIDARRSFRPRVASSLQAGGRPRSCAMNVAFAKVLATSWSTRWSCMKFDEVSTACRQRIRGVERRVKDRPCDGRVARLEVSEEGLDLFRRESFGSATTSWRSTRPRLF